MRYVGQEHETPAQRAARKEAMRGTRVERVVEDGPSATELAACDERLFGAELEHSRTYLPYVRNEVTVKDGARHTYTKRTYKPIMGETSLTQLERPTWRERALHENLMDEKATRGTELRTRGTMRMLEARKALVGTSEAVVSMGLDLTWSEWPNVLKAAREEHEDDAWDVAMAQMAAHVEREVGSKMGTHMGHVKGTWIVKLALALRDVAKGNRLLDHARQAPR